MHIIFLTKILGIFAVSLNPQPVIIQNWIKKNASKVPNNLLKNNCEIEVCASCNVINIKYTYVCTILIFRIIDYVVIE